MNISTQDQINKIKYRFNKSNGVSIGITRFLTTAKAPLTLSIHNEDLGKASASQKG